MSILTDLFEGKITFSQAATKAEAWASSIVSKDPALTALTGDALSAVKQAASNAVMLADTELGQHAGAITTAVQTSLDAAFAAATGGASVPFAPIINSGVAQLVAAAKSAADAWALELQGKLATPSLPAQMQAALSLPQQAGGALSGG